MQIPINDIIPKRRLMAEAPLSVFAIVRTPNIHLEQWVKDQTLHQIVAYTAEEGINATNIRLQAESRNPDFYTVTHVSSLPVSKVMGATQLNATEIGSFWGLSVNFPSKKEQNISSFIYGLQYMADQYADTKEKKVIDNLISKLKNVQSIPKTNQ